VLSTALLAYILIVVHNLINAMLSNMLNIFSILFLISINIYAQNEKVMKSNTKAYNEQLSDFAFIIGRWECDVNIKKGDDEFEQNEALWTGRYILDGNAIEDEYRETNEDGELIRLGINIRSYNNENGWTMKWFDALNSSWLDLGPKELGGVHVNSSSISFKHFALNDMLVRITFFDIKDDSFSWKADVSNDNGKTWDEKVFTIIANRIN